VKEDGLIDIYMLLDTIEDSEVELLIFAIDDSVGRAVDNNYLQ